ncbi:DUF2141 domain-containing protein [Terricaulis sp.]|uniref:DUF2141 domain-containing protein n=1 Tax=Terricaulis sp. TaxID=2768686 RepID=UPI002AC70467|nr:DUF2141 domain-containing protein [Terricaulis sp.]MDZ4692473.1 DUF2141 domain-containing protein [Terricaulis sp.]
MYRSIIAALVLATVAVPTARAQDASGALTVQLSGLEPQGAVMIQIFASETAYAAGQAASAQRVVVDGATEEARFEGLAPGQYAVRLFHDVNGDGRFNTNPFGIPTEPFAFSNNARGTFGPASWSQAAFALNAGENTQAIAVGGGQ